MLTTVLTQCADSYNHSYTLRYDQSTDDFYQGCIAGLAILQQNQYDASHDATYLEETIRNVICLEALENFKATDKHIRKINPL